MQVGRWLEVHRRSSPAACRKCCGAHISLSHNESERKNMEHHTKTYNSRVAATRIAITPGWLLMLYFKTHSH